MNKTISAIVALLVSALVSFGVLYTAPRSGSITGPDIASRYLNWGGVTQWNSGIAVNSATSSTICSIQAPPATSTVMGIGLRIDSNGMGTQVLDIATSTNPYGTSTPSFVASASLPTAGNVPLAWQPGLLASTTGATAALYRAEAFTKGTTPFIIGPNEYLNFKIASGTPGVFAAYATGKCTARFQAL